MDYQELVIALKSIPGLDVEAQGKKLLCSVLKSGSLEFCSEEGPLKRDLTYFDLLGDEPSQLFQVLLDLFSDLPWVCQVLSLIQIYPKVYNLYLNSGCYSLIYNQYQLDYTPSHIAKLDTSIHTSMVDPSVREALEAQALKDPKAARLLDLFTPGCSLFFT